MPDGLTIQTDAELSILYHPLGSQPTTWQRVDYIGLLPLRRRQVHGYWDGLHSLFLVLLPASLTKDWQSTWFTNMGLYVTSSETKGAPALGSWDNGYATIGTTDPTAHHFIWKLLARKNFGMPHKRFAKIQLEKTHHGAGTLVFKIQTMRWVIIW